MNIDAEVLIKEAIEARKMAYTPYSHFKVGAALLLTADGKFIVAAILKMQAIRRAIVRSVLHSLKLSVRENALLRQ